jgi:hypothetical protein
MRRKFKMKPKASKKLFRKTASRTHKKNTLEGKIMRGGYRL